MPYFKNQGAKLYYEEKGHGNPLIFLHGFGLDMRQWERQVDIFSTEYRVITLDARGHGKSTLPEEKVDNSVFWKDVIALMDYLEIKKAIICGLSMGGHVAIQTAINANKRVESLVLMGTICTNQFNRYECYLVPVNRFCQRLMPMSWIAWSVSVGMGNFSPESKSYIREVVGSMNHDVYNRLWKAVSTMESRDGLSKIDCPTLILIGDHDSMTARQQPYLAEHIPNSHLITIENAHHCTNLDNPEHVEKEIRSFLNKAVMKNEESEI